jgi:hypothetical protein
MTQALRSTPRSPRPASALTALVVLAALAIFSPGPVCAEDLVDGFALSAGVFNVLNEDRSAEAGFELRLRPLWEGTAERPWVLRPAAGAMATSEEAIYGYAGFRLEIPLGERWSVVPQSTAGYYERGDEKELGGSVQFRSGLELSYRLSPAHSVGAVFYHLSNAGLERPNPGSESLVLFWAWR